MRDRHWDGLSSDLGMDLHPGPKFTLSQAQEMGLLDHLDTITRVVSARQYALVSNDSF